LRKLTDFLIEEYYNKGKKCPPCIIVIDSLGNMASQKEIDDIAAGTGKSDMTRAKTIKQLFRILTTNIGVLQIPCILTNHTYKDIMSYIPKDIQSGGSGGKYGGSTIINLTKAKLKDDDGKQSGINVTALVVKSRFTAVGTKKKFRIENKRGMNKYIGLQSFLKPETFKEIGIGIGKINKDGEFECAWKEDMELTKTGYVITDEKGNLKNVKINDFFTKNVFTLDRLEKLDKFVGDELKFNNINNDNDYFDDETEDEIENVEMSVETIIETDNEIDVDIVEDELLELD
jgi:RecA/RadA recombinase